MGEEPLVDVDAGGTAVGVYTAEVYLTYRKVALSLLR
jgi:hypothetical protein